MRKVLIAAILAFSVAGLGCSESTGGGASPKPANDSNQLQPLPTPGGPGGETPKPGKPGGGAPGGTPISQ